MGEYADMALEEQELEGILNPRRGPFRAPFRARLVNWLEHRNRKRLAKSIAVLTGFAPTVVHLVLIGSRDDLLVTRLALEHATVTSTRPVPANVIRSECRWEPTLGWERIRALAEARAIMLAGVKRMLQR